MNIGDNENDTLLDVILEEFMLTLNQNQKLIKENNELQRKLFEEVIIHEQEKNKHK